MRSSDMSAARQAMSPILTTSMEDYIKAIYKAQRRHGRATTVLIANRMQVSAASVTKMLKRLARFDLALYEPYQGAELTETGRCIALEIIRHHRLLELYLAERMGYSWDEVDAEAEALEHVISEAFEARIDALLGYPDTDPHGHPIPSREGHIRDNALYTPLDQIEAGERAVVRRVSDRDSRRLRRFGDLGLFPGRSVHVLAFEAGRLQMRVAGSPQEMESVLAEGVYVERAAPKRCMKGDI